MHRYFIVVPISELLRIWLGHLHKGSRIMTVNMRS